MPCYASKKLPVRTSPVDFKALHPSGMLITQSVSNNQLNLFDVAWLTCVHLEDAVIFRGEPNILNALHLLTGEEMSSSDLDFATSLARDMPYIAVVKLLTTFTKTIRPKPYFGERFKKVWPGVMPLVIRAFQEEVSETRSPPWGNNTRVREHWSPCDVNHLATGLHETDIDYLPVNTNRQFLKKGTRIDVMEVKPIQHGLTEVTGTALLPDEDLPVNFLTFNCELKKV